jgi:hypothetical protein
MKFMKNLVLMSALSFLITSNVLAKTTLVTTNHFAWTPITKTQKAAVKKSVAKKAAVKKAAVKKIVMKKSALKKAGVKKVAVNKAAESKAPENKTPENKALNINFQDTKPVPAVTAVLTAFEVQEATHTQDLDDSHEAKWTPLAAKEEIDSPNLDGSDVLKWTALDVKLDVDTEPLSKNRAYFVDEPSSVPVPAAAWLLGSALIGFVSFSKRRHI